MFVNVIQAQPRSYAFSTSTIASIVTLSDTALRYQTVVTDLTVPEIRVWPLDGSLDSLDGQAPLQSRGISFVPGRFDRAAEFSRAADSRGVYRAAGNVDPNEGSLTLWIRPTYDLTDTAYLDRPQVFSYAIDRDNQLVVAVGGGVRFWSTSINRRVLRLRLSVYGHVNALNGSAMSFN
jgi:hypothetical protein